MIILDTNVLSEPLRPAPAASVVEWLDAQGEHRTRSRLVATIDFYLRSCAMDGLPAHDIAFFTESAVAICARRVFNFEAQS